MPAPTVQELLESIAENVRRTRARLGMTQEALCEAAGFDIRFIQKVERARLNFSVETLARIATALEVKPAALLRSAKLRPARPGRPAADTGPRRKRSL